jgi:hypothetical protein
MIFIVVSARDDSLDLLGSDPNIERDRRVKQQYFTYWLLWTCKDKTRLVTKCNNEVLIYNFYIWTDD